MRMFKGLVIMVALATIAACTVTTDHGHGHDEAAAQNSSEIAALSDRWETAFKAGDVDGVVALYADDARVLAPNAAMERGAAAVKTAFAGMIDAGLSGELTTVQAMAAGDLGYNLGTYRLWNKTDETEVDRGKFIEIWGKVDGEWKITEDIWNSDLPCAAEEAETHDHP